MHFAVISGGIPNLETSGGSQTSWLIIKALLDAGHRVTTCLLLNLSDPWLEERKDKRLADLGGLGTEVISVPCALPTQPPSFNRLEKFRRLLAPTLESIFPSIRLAPQMKKILEQVHPDALFLFDLDAVAATHGLTVAPRIAGLGALPHILQTIRLKQTPKEFSRSYFKLTLNTFLGNPGLKRLMIRLLSECEAISNFGADQVAELHRLGLGSCLYFKNPAYDFGGPDWRKRREHYEDCSKFKILLIGHLQGTFTRHGLHLFVDEILPVLEQRFDQERLEIHIVGNFSPTKDLATKLSSPMIKLRGWVERVDPEYLSAHVLLVPNPIPLGQRMRVLAGLSCGCCIVAHRANLVASPELVSEENILVANDGIGLAEAILRALADPALRDRLGTAGRQTFEEYYALPVAGARIVAELEQIAWEHKNHHD